MNLASYFRPPAIARFVMVRYVGAACALSGCVPSTQYEQASSAAEVEREGHRRAAERLAAAEAALKKAQTERDALSIEKKALEADLHKDQQELAQANVDMQNTEKAREQEQLLVTQLRGELARSAEHLKSYQSDKSELETQLREAEQRLSESERRITTLEAEIENLRQRASSAADAKQQLVGALDELAALQKRMDEQKAAEKDAAADKPTSGDGDSAAGSDVDDNGIDDNGIEDKGEVLPSEEP